MLKIKHGGNEPLTDAMPLDIEPLTFEQLNNAELWRDWKRERVAEIAANSALADSYDSAGFGGLVIEALGYEAYRALGGDGRVEKNNDFR